MRLEGRNEAVLRGGGWDNFAPLVRAPFRGTFSLATRPTAIGFRCAKTLDLR